MDLISNLGSASGWVNYADTDHLDLFGESLALVLAKFLVTYNPARGLQPKWVYGTPSQ